jgi:NADPH:quinone reductase-like Zn-dependent oxidoreductase
LQRLRRWARDGGQQATPGQDDAHAIGDAGQGPRQGLDRGADVQQVGEPLVGGARRERAQSRGDGVDADEQALGLRPRPEVREPAVAGAEVDRDAAREAGQRVSESMIRAFEALAAYDVHVRPGAHAEFAAVPERLLEPLPRGLSFPEAAALPAAGMSALIVVRDLARVRSGQRVLVNGAAGGVGHLVLQLLREAGATAVAVAGPDKLDLARELGTAEVVDHSREDFVRRGGRYDAVLDLVPNRSFPACRPLLLPRGAYVTTLPRAVSIAWAAWTALRAALRPGPRCRVLMLRPNPRDLRAVAERAAAGALRPHLGASFPLEETRRAHEWLEAGHARGKLVLTLDSTPGRAGS